MRGAKAAALPLVAILLFLCGQTAAPATSDSQPGRIEGTVTYENGSPAGGATVFAHPMGVPFVGIIPHSKANKDGHFAIAHLWLGKYFLGAEKLDQDYPNTIWNFYSDGKGKTVVLTARHFVAKVTVPLGPKAGILTGTVTDAVTGARLYVACEEFRWANRPRNSTGGNGLVNAKYRMLIPSDTPILMKVWYRGHKPWYYPGTTEKAQRRPVTLRPGEELRVDIRLEPDPRAHFRIKCW